MNPNSTYIVAVPLPCFSYIKLVVIVPLPHVALLQVNLDSLSDPALLVEIMKEMIARSNK